MNKMRGYTKKLKRIFIMFVLLLCSTIGMSCSNISGLSDNKDPEPEKGQYKIYCLNSASDSLHWELATLSSASLEGKLDELCSLLKASPKKSSYISAIPENVKILSSRIGADGQLVIVFSEKYNSMDSITEALCRASVVKTFCQLEEIEYIEFEINDQPLRLKDVPVGLMTAEDFVDNSDNGSDLSLSVLVKLYLTDKEGKMLQETTLKVVVDGTKPMEEIVLNELIAGPLESQTQLEPVVNSRTKINKVRSYDGVCYVDFDETFLTKQEGISDEVAVYSVVNTLCELQGITKVRITVNGNEKKNFGKEPMNDFMSLRPELIKTEKAGEFTGNN